MEQIPGSTVAAVHLTSMECPGHALDRSRTKELVSSTARQRAGGFATPPLQGTSMSEEASESRRKRHPIQVVARRTGLSLDLLRAFKSFILDDVEKDLPLPQADVA